MRPHLEVHDDWEWDDETKTRGLTTISVNGIPHHLEAYEVEMKMALPDASPGLQEAAAPEFQATLDRVYDALGGDGPWYTVEIEGRDYVLIMSPFCT